MTENLNVDDTGIETVVPPEPALEPVAEPQAAIDEPAEAQKGRVAAARRVAGKRGTGETATPVQITGPDDYEALKPGTLFIDPDGKTRKKPWSVTGEEDYALVPEGETFVDPSGATRQKPKYENVDFTTQTLYNMAVNDKERRKALERAYPGKIKETEGTGELYVDDDGTRRKPKSFMDATGGFLAAQAAPVLGSVAGDIAGSQVGNRLLPGLGGMAGAIVGGGLGGVGGQVFNDMVLQLSGVYDRSSSEEAGALVTAGAAGAGGSSAGRLLAMLAPGIKGVWQNFAPKAAARFLGADQKGLETAIALREKGVDVVPPSGWAKEAPHLQNIAEVFDPAFRTQKPLMEAAAGHYEKAGAEVLEGVGAKTEGSLIEPAAAPSTREAGEALLAKRVEASKAADDKLTAELNLRRSQLETQAATSEVDRKAIDSAAAVAQREAQKLIDEGFVAIQKDVDTAMAAAKAGQNSGDLWWNVGEKLKAVKQGISLRAKKMYNEADVLAGDNLPNIEGLPQIADDFIRQLPEGFERQHPTIVKQIRDLAGVVDEKTGAYIKEPIEPTFGQLHDLRSVLRSNYNYLDLAPSIKEGTYKFFANKVDNILNDIDAVPALREAAKALRNADNFYRENMGPLTDRNIQAVMNGLESGLPADPKNLFNTLVKEGRSDLTRKVADLVGPNLWAGVKAADVQEMLDLSKTLIPGQIDGRAFVKQVLDRHRTNMLEAVHGREASAKLIKQAQDIQMLEGKLPIEVRPGDTVSDVIQKARMAADAAKEAAKADPLKTLARDMKQIQSQHAQQLSRMRKEDPLGFIYDPTVGATQAVDRVLGNEDLILAAGARFGDKSPEFNLLRQVWAQRLLQGTMDPGARLAKVSPEVQALMFPGVSLNQMQTLAKEMDFLMSTKAAQGTGKSIAATEKVEHPWASIPGGKAVGKFIPGVDAGGRSMLGNYYKMVLDLSNNLTFLRWVEKGLKGDEAGREMTRQAVQRAMNRGGMTGAGGAQGMAQASHDQDDPELESVQ